MGMFDYLRCKYPLPVAGANELVFQTKDTPEQYLDTYTIREDGKLCDKNDTPVENFTGEVQFYCDYGKKDNHGWGHGWMEFSSYFIAGKLQSVTLIENREPPANPCERCGGSGWEKFDFTAPKNKRCIACQPAEQEPA